jgi:hypothetical protein
MHPAFSSSTTTQLGFPVATNSLCSEMEENDASDLDGERSLSANELMADTTTVRKQVLFLEAKRGKK